METNRAILALLLTTCLSVVVASQAPLVKKPPVSEQRGPVKLNFPEGIELPAGFVHERRNGIDSRGGIIKRDDGFTIRYDLGGMAGIYAEQYFPAYFEARRRQPRLNQEVIESHIRRLDRAVEWRKEEDVGGEKVMTVLLKDGKIIASFPGSCANFFAETDSAEKVSEFLRIVRTYRSPKKKVE